MRAAMVAAVNGPWEIKAVLQPDIEGLRLDGRLVTLGIDPDSIPVSLEDLIGRRIQVMENSQNGREYLHEALDFVAKGKVRVAVEHYALADAPKAYRRVVEGKVRFRPVSAIQRLTGSSGTSFAICAGRSELAAASGPSHRRARFKSYQCRRWPAGMRLGPQAAVRFSPWRRPQQSETSAGLLRA